MYNDHYPNRHTVMETRSFTCASLHQSVYGEPTLFSSWIELDCLEFRQEKDIVS